MSLRKECRRKCEMRSKVCRQAIHDERYSHSSEMTSSGEASTAMTSVSNSFKRLSLPASSQTNAIKARSISPKSRLSDVVSTW